MNTRVNTRGSRTGNRAAVSAPQSLCQNKLQISEHALNSLFASTGGARKEAIHMSYAVQCLM